MKLWGGRFKGNTDSMANHFHSSIAFDCRLYNEDIQGSKAHAKMLGQQGIISQEDAELLCKTLDEVLQDIQDGNLEFSVQAEDIHMNIETELIKRIGDVGKRLHTGRSRNDQVALDIRMYVKKEIKIIQSQIKEIIKILLILSKSHTKTVMPGYTHLQKAQPITFAHHLLAYAEMFKRDNDRLSDSYTRTDIMPLGSGALAATTYNLDREYVKTQLDFAQITLNSLDAVSDRDFLIELTSALSILMMHLSRFCEEIILWSSHEFGFIELDDAYCTGSSIMPQKKNPDMAELIRGKTGRVFGDLMGLLTVMKGLPLAYNKDMQEDKESVFDAIDTVKMCLPVFSGMVSTMKVNVDKMRLGATGGFTNATDAADWLVKKGVAFRDAHEILGKLVLYCIENNKHIEQLTLAEFQQISDVFDDTIYDAISLETCVNSRKIEGGPSAEWIEKLISINEEYLQNSSKEHNMEIERKFLVENLPLKIDGYKKLCIQQSYISTKPVIRLRKSNDDYILTVKGAGRISRQEFELSLQESEYEKLKKLVTSKIITKERFLIPIEDGYTAELDIYEGELKGLMTVEVEFSSLDNAEKFVAPNWFGKEVTDDSRYSNSSLAKYGLPVN